MSSEEIEDAVALLQRHDILEACRTGPTSRTGVAEAAGCSRSTAYRATVELSRRGLVEQADQKIRLTGAGRAVLDHAQQFVAKIEGTNEITAMFEYVDELAFVRQSHLFTDAEVITHEPSSPYHIENRVKEIIDDTAERLVGVTTGLGSPALADAMFQRIREGVHAEWMLPSGMYDQFNAEHGDLSAHAITDEQTAVYVIDDVPVDLAIYDETLLVIGFDRKRGVLGAVAITDESAAVEWGRDVIEDCREAATRIE